MKLPSFGVRLVIKEAWRVLKTQPKYIILFLLAIAGVKVVEGLVSSGIDNQGWTVAASIWGVLTSLVDMYVGIITLTVSLKLIRGVKMTLAETWFTDKQAIVQYLLVTIVYGFLVVVGYILLIVPGVILQLTYSLATYLVIDKGMKVKEALAESRRLTTGNRWKILEIGLALVLINVGGALAIGLGLLVTIPLSMIASAVIYTQLSSEGMREPMKKFVKPAEVAATPKSDVPASAEMPVETKANEPKPVATDEMNQYQI